MATTADIKNGLCIEMNNDLFTVIEFLHVKPGKGAAFVRTKLKSFKTGRTLEHTFPAGCKIETCRVENRCKFLFSRYANFVCSIFLLPQNRYVFAMLKLDMI